MKMILSGLMISMVGKLLFTTEGTEVTETTEVSRSKAYAIWLLNQRRRDEAFTVRSDHGASSD
ncbi:hypothetical protein P9J64_00850 [Deltaproteobacteria bacterium IMCC39524]|nr:hypothetical protein [Deltaproteobacteria bacterium IMCC39524]